MKKILSLLLLLSISSIFFAQTNVSGVISSDTTWNLANSPYTVTGDIGIFPGATLIIDAGVTVNFNGDFQILNKGNVTIVGTSASHITFNGNNAVGSKRMLMFKSTDLANSSINYVDFTGNQYAVQLADEAEHNQDAIKNTNILTIQNASFTNTGVFTKGYGTTAELVINNSTFDNSTIKGYYPRTEPITLNNCTADNSTINSDSYNYGINIFNSTIKNSTITMGCCSANFDIQNSIIYKTSISEGGGSPVNGDFKITNSKFIDSPINLNSARFTITNSIISDKTNNDLINLGNCTIVNSSFIGDKSKNAINISGRAGYNIGGSTSITTSLINEVNNALVFNGVNTVSISDNNFINIEQYSIKNLASTGFTASSNYWGTIIDAEIQSLIYDSYDNLDYGQVTYTPFLTTLNTLAPIAPPVNFTKAQSGSDVVFNWTANGESDTEGYKLYYGNPTGYSYSNEIDLGNVTTYTLTGGTLGTEYAITAYDTSKDGTDDQVDGNESWYAVANQITVTLAVSDTSISENAGTTNITATLSGTSSANVVVNLTYTGTSIKGTDYTANNSITIPAGSLSASIALNASQDTDVEITETIIVDIDSVNGGSEDGVQQVSINLTDDDKPTVSLAFSKTAISEAGGSTIITATQSAITSNLTTIDFDLTGTAITDTDYTTTFNSKGYSTVAGGNGYGSASNQFSNPAGIYVDTSGYIYIADNGNYRIQKWAPGASSGTTVAGGNGYGSSSNQFSNITGFYVDTSGNIYIADNGNNRIQKWAPGASSGTTVAGGNGYGSANNQLSSPSDVYVDTSNNIYIADTGNHRIQKWISGATSGTTVAGGNGNGSANNQLYSAHSVYVDASGNIYIADLGNNRIQKWAPGATSGTTVAGGNGQGSASNQLFNPYSIYVDASSNIYIADNGNNRIQRWILGATSGTTVAGGNGQGSANNQLSGPYDVFVDLLSNIYIADLNNNRIQKLQVSAQIKIAAGETTGTLTLTGLEDTLNNEGDETIIVTPTATNATLASSGATTITLQNYNQAPVATPQSVTATEQTDKTITLAGTDAEGDPLTYIVVTLPTNGTLTDPNNANAVITAGTTITGTDVTYTSTSDSATSDSFTFIVNDGSVDSDVAATVAITITPVNDLPSATAQNITATEQTDKTITLVGTDADNDTLTYIIVTAPTNGTAVLNGNIVTYTSTSDTATSDSFTFKVNDGTVDSPEATVNITITAINDAPVATAQNITATEQTDKTITLAGTDAESDPLTYIVVTVPTNGTLTDPNNANAVITAGTTITGTDVTYTSTSDSATSDSFTFKVNDGTVDSNVVATVAITITPVNDLPSATAQNITATEQTDKTITLAGTDADNDTLTYTIVTAPTNGTAVLNGNIVTYTSTSDTATSDSFTFKVNDGTVDSPEATVNITITAVNDAPVANDDSMTVDEGGSSTLLSNGLTSILTNDTDAEGDAITAILVNDVSNGTLVLNSDGTFTYTHNGSETLTDSFTYKANDGLLDGNIAIVNITINPINDNAPTDIILSNYTIDENVNNQTIGTISATDLDVNDTFTFSLVSGNGDSGNANFLIINGNELKNSVAFDYETQTQYSIRVKVVDSGGLSFEKNLTIDVTNLNDITINYVTSDSYCSGTQSNGYINVTSINETVGNVSFSWLGPNGFTSSSQNISNLEQGTYQLTVSDDAFQKTISIDVGLKPIYNDLSICYISSDNVQYTNNRIYFNNVGNYNVDKYQVLREGSVSGVYDLIGEVDATENSYLDLTSDNNSSSYNYKVRAKDLCGNISNESSVHRTLLLQSSVAIDNTVNLSWSAYQGVSYQTYKIYRNYNNEGFVELVSLSSSNLNYNDKTADVTNGDYKYYVSIAVSSCNTGAKNRANKTNVTNEIRSNQIILQSGSLGLADELFNNSIKFYPNPTTKTFSISSKIFSITKVEIYSALGKKVKEVNSDFKTIKTDELSVGIYIIRIYAKKGISIRKLIKK